MVILGILLFLLNTPSPAKIVYYIWLSFAVVNTAFMLISCDLKVSLSSVIVYTKHAQTACIGNY